MTRRYENEKCLVQNRLKNKTGENALFVELRKSYGMNQIEAESLIGRLQTIQNENDINTRTDGQIVWYAISDKEPSGKPIRYCKKVKIKLTMQTASDIIMLVEKGSIALREAKLLRLAEETYRQGGLLSQEDLGALLCVDRDTVKRIIDYYEKQGIIVPTRGQIKGIGRGPSHKAIIIQLLLKDYTISDIAVRTGHSVYSVKEYVQDFSIVLVLIDEGYSISEIRKVTKMSEGLIREYVDLYKQYGTSEYRSKILEIKEYFNGIPIFKKEVNTWVG
jgi:DNA-binding transcriptional MerR regulator